MGSSAVSAGRTIPEEDLLRAQFYRFLARFLAGPPDESLLRLAAGLDGDDTELGRGIGTLARLAAEVTAVAARDEYDALFIGISRGELVPYGSYYLTGFLNEKPLAALRRDMADLGIVRAEEVKEPEDHIASLCEIMAGLITGEFGRSGSLDEQKAMFRKHLAPWAGRFFEDLEAAKSAVLYAPIGRLGRLFVAIEATAFEMEA